MNFIRPREIFVYVIAACTVFACATGSTNTGGGGEGGDDSWGGPSSSSKSSSGSGGGSSSSSGSGGPTVCDSTSADCSTCITCSRTGADGLCGKPYNDCLANTDCTDFATCVANCADGDMVCTSNCESFYPTGVPIFDAYASCVICQDCYVICDGASSCM